MTTIPAPGADLATERLRDLLTAAGNASFECGAHDCDGDGGDPAPYAELARIAAEKRAEIVEFFRATIAAVPASEPVARICGTWELRWIGAGPIAPIVHKHGLKIGDFLYAAAPAPVSGMPDRPEILAARAEGRAEAVLIIMALDPEDALNDCMVGSGPCPATGEYDTHWDEAKLREKFSAGDKLFDMELRLDTAFYEYQEARMVIQYEAEQRRAATPNPTGASK